MEKEEKEEENEELKEDNKTLIVRVAMRTYLFLPINDKLI